MNFQGSSQWGSVIRLQHFTDSNCWLFLFSTELPFRNTGFVRTDIEGENITFGCSGTVYKKQKFLCKDECKTKEDIIIETNGNRTQRGRYSVEYREGSTFGLYVNITNVSKSDTGWYKCGYGRALSPHSFYKFSIFVIDGECLLKSHEYSVLLKLIDMPVIQSVFLIEFLSSISDHEIHLRFHCHFIVHRSVQTKPDSSAFFNIRPISLHTNSAEFKPQFKKFHHLVVFH